MGLSNYPPGVTGGESAITGEWSGDELNDEIETVKTDVEKRIDGLLATFDDQGALSDKDFQAIEYKRQELFDLLDELQVQTEPEYD